MLILPYVMNTFQHVKSGQILDADGLDLLVRQGEVVFYDAYAAITRGLDARISTLGPIYCLVQVSSKPLYATLRMKMHDDVGLVVDGPLQGSYVQNMPGIGVVPLSLDVEEY